MAVVGGRHHKTELFWGTPKKKKNFVLFKTTELIFNQVAEAVGDIQKNIIRSLADSLMGMVVLEFSKNENYLKNGIDRKTELTFQFRQLVQKHFLELKKPKFILTL